MPFPIRVGELVVPHARGLGYLIARELSRPDPLLGSTEAWVVELLPALSEAEAASLLTSLLTASDRRASALGHHLVPVLRPGVAARLLDGLPPSTLFQMCVGGPLDVVLARRASTGNIGDAALRRRVIEVLRIEGDGVSEALVLAREGEEPEIRSALPALLESGAEVRAALSTGADRSPALREALQGRSERDH